MRLSSSNSIVSFHKPGKEHSMRGYRLCSFAACAVLMVSMSAGHAFARIGSVRESTPQVVVLNYFTIANQALAGGDVDNFGLVFADDATLTASNPAGVTVTAHGLPAIERWFKTWARAAAGLQLTETSMRSPMPGLVLHYETAVNAYEEPVAHCAHVFVVRNGMIVSDDFITFNHMDPLQIAPVHHGNG
jgi:hypothetical protein